MVKDASLLVINVKVHHFYIRLLVEDEAIGSHAWQRTRVLLVIKDNVHQFYIS